MRLFIIIIALVLGITDDGSKKGRKGNEQYREEQYSEATTHYRDGLETASTEKPRVLAGLWNNLGSSLFRTGEFEESRNAFSNALGSAQSETEISHFAYNTGNSIYRQANNASGAPSASGAPAPSASGAGGGQALQESLNYYRQALLADPTNEDARYNYEFVKRQMEEQEQNQDEQQNQDQQNQDQEQNQDQQQQDQEQNQDQQNQDQQNQDQQDQDQQNQDQQQQDQQQQDQQQQQQQPQNDPTKLSREEAERILQALQNEEEELLRQVMKPQGRPKKVEKDW